MTVRTVGAMTLIISARNPPDVLPQAMFQLHIWIAAFNADSRSAGVLLCFAIGDRQITQHLL